MAFIRLTGAAIAIALPLTLMAAPPASSHGSPGRVRTATYHAHRDKLGLNLSQPYRSPMSSPFRERRTRG